MQKYCTHIVLKKAMEVFSFEIYTNQGNYLDCVIQYLMIRIDIRNFSE